MVNINLICHLRTNLCEMLNFLYSGENPDFKRSLVDDVSGLLKKYLRELPGSILTDGTPEDHLQTAFKQTLGTKIFKKLDTV